MKREEKYNVRLSERERAILKRLAKERGLKESAMLRYALLDYDRRHPPPETVTKS